jgi:Signal peptidase (SPase) II
MPLWLRLLNLAAVAIAVAVVDWSLKVWATIELPPEEIVLNTDRQWHAIPVCLIIGAGLVAVARTPLLAFAAGVVMGGSLGNLGEQWALGHVTDFIPLGIPSKGATWSPADFFLILGLVLLWVGAVQARRRQPSPPPMPMPGNQASSTAPSAITASPMTQRSPLDMSS